MKSINYSKFICLSFLLFFQALFAEVTLPAIVSSNMVLQRDTTVVIWGWADANENITIDVSWLDKAYKVNADAEGNWRLEVKTTTSTQPQTIKIKSKTSHIELNNILFGEVWLCSGQSNMQQPLAGYTGQPTFGSVLATANSNNPNLRLFTVNRAGSKTPLIDVGKYIGWQQATPESVYEFSAIGYFFGMQLQRILNVPVGVIHTSWGGSTVEAWMSKEVINTINPINLDSVDINKNTNHIPTALYNAMINPLIPFTIKGVLWYQGESNRSNPEAYKKLFPAMVQDWRTRWNIGDFPFYYVQIAPYIYGGNDAYSISTNSAHIREVQLQCLDIIPNSGMAITMDVGDAQNIHPPQKREVADRLLFIALNQTYGYKSIDYSGPIYLSKTQKDKGILLSFKNAERGLFSKDTLEGFEIAGSDKVFYPAKAKIVNAKNIYVESDKVLNPTEVRYAWRNWVQGTLYTTSLLPASSFRTDTWDNATSFSE